MGKSVTDMTVLDLARHPVILARNLLEVKVARDFRPFLVLVLPFLLARYILTFKVVRGLSLAVVLVQPVSLARALGELRLAGDIRPFYIIALPVLLAAPAAKSAASIRPLFLLAQPVLLVRDLLTGQLDAPGDGDGPATADALESAAADRVRRAMPGGLIGLDSSSVEWGVIAARIIVVSGVTALTLVDGDMRVLRLVAAPTAATVLAYSVGLGWLLRRGHVREQVALSVVLDTATIVTSVLFAAWVIGANAIRIEGQGISARHIYQAEHSIFRPMLALLVLAPLRLRPAAGVLHVLGLSSAAVWASYVFAGGIFPSLWLARQHIALALAGIAAVFISYFIQRMRTQLAKNLEDRTQLLASVTHEIRNPLASVRASVDLALEETPPQQKEVLRALGLASRGVRRLEQLAQSLADLELMSALGNERSGEPFDLASAAESAISASTAAAADRDLRLRFEPEPGLPLALGNEAHAARITANLLSNAIKFSPRGEEIIIRTFRTEDRVGLLVSDRGPGIPAQELPRIFDRFYRGPQAMKARAAGAGLGLYISAQLAGRIGGEIRVSSNPRRGSVFELLLAAQPGSPSRPEGTQLILPGHQAATGARNSTVLAP